MKVTVQELAFIKNVRLHFTCSYKGMLFLENESAVAKALSKVVKQACLKLNIQRVFILEVFKLLLPLLLAHLEINALIKWPYTFFKLELNLRLIITTLLLYLRFQELVVKILYVICKCLYFLILRVELLLRLFLSWWVVYLHWLFLGWGVLSLGGLLGWSTLFL